jgi:hypothetical protein
LIGGALGWLYDQAQRVCQRRLQSITAHPCDTFHSTA